ncbi:proteasome subunit domain-containing protein [Phthorimaea operculella]|nr:proteasome subunit domain-containing protein [Phthorimaea operculella]
MVQYARQAVSLSSPVVGIRGGDAVVIASEKKPLPFLSVTRTEKKIAALDNHVAMGYAGLRADARVLFNRAQVECRCYHLSVDEPVSVEYIARYIAQVKQLFTQYNARRPFGLSCLIGGVNPDGELKLYQTEPSGIFYEWKYNARRPFGLSCLIRVNPDGELKLYQTEPSGIFYEWKAACTGRNEKEIRAYLEKHYTPEAVATEEGVLNLAVRTLLEHQLPEASNSYEVAIIKQNQPVVLLDQNEVNALVCHLRSQKETEDRTKK